MLENGLNRVDLRIVCSKTFALYIGLVIVGTSFVAPSIDYYCKTDVASAGFFSLAAAIIAVFAMGILIAWFKTLSLRKILCHNTTFNVVVGAGCVLLILIQAIIVQGAWFTTAWDAGIITDFGNAKSHVDYYSMYPNQLFLMNLFEAIAKIGAILGFENGYLCVVCVGCALVTAANALVAFASKSIRGYSAGYLTLVIGGFFVGLSPWILVPYSDTYAMFFTCAALFSYTCVKRSSLKWFLITLLTLIGYAIKPTVIFALLAFIAMDIAKVVTRPKETTLRASSSGLGKALFVQPAHIGPEGGARKATGIIGWSVAAIAISFSITASMQSANLELDENRAFSATHFLMMGFNLERPGGWNADDVNYSKSFETRLERQSANLAVWRERVESMGVMGVAKLLAMKSFSNYADGTFSWGLEGHFFQAAHGNNEALKRVYGIADGELSGSNVVQAPLFAPFAQIIWIALLIGIAVGLGRKLFSREEAAISLSLLFLSIFLMLFECRARYLLLYAPYFVTLGVIGWFQVSDWLQRSVVRLTSMGASTNGPFKDSHAPNR